MNTSAQLDLFAPRVASAHIDRPAPHAPTARRTCPIVIGGLPQGITSNIPTMIVDAIKGTVRLVAVLLVVVAASEESRIYQLWDRYSSAVRVA